MLTGLPHGASALKTHNSFPEHEFSTQLRNNWREGGTAFEEGLDVGGGRVQMSVVS